MFLCAYRFPTYQSISFDAYVPFHHKRAEHNNLHLPKPPFRAKPLINLHANHRLYRFILSGPVNKAKQKKKN